MKRIYNEIYFAFIFRCEKENLESLLKKIITNKDLKGEIKTGQGLWISVKLLPGDFKQVSENYYI